MLLALSLAVVTLGSDAEGAPVAPTVDVQTGQAFDHPFDSLPRAEPVAAAPSATADQSDGQNHYVVFQGPASFEVNSPFPCGAQTTTNTAVIYEGMALRFDASTGKYTVRLIAETPATDVTLRLQLVVHERTSVTPEVLQRRGTITLPPIRLEAAAQPVGEGRHRLWRIEHSGYSPVLRCKQGFDPQVLTVERVGAAEFGMVPPR